MLMKLERWAPKQNAFVLMFGVEEKKLSVARETQPHFSSLGAPPAVDAPHYNYLSFPNFSPPFHPSISRDAAPPSFAVSILVFVQLLQLRVPPDAAAHTADTTGGPRRRAFRTGRVPKTTNKAYN